MKLRILSDLHIDIRDFQIRPLDEDILILAGDISDKPEDTFNIIKKYMENANKKVIFVMGNHDYFNDCINERIKYWYHFGEKLGKNFHFLNQNSIIIDDIEFYGTTLWSDINIHKNEKRFLRYNDLTCIYKSDIYTPITPSDYKNMYEAECKGLIKFLNTPNDNKKRIIITHFLPSYKSVSIKYIGNENNDMFASNLDDIINHYDIKMWIHGHTHETLDYNIGNTRIVCNARGKIGENMNFKENLIINI